MVCLTPFEAVIEGHAFERGLKGCEVRALLATRGRLIMKPSCPAAKRNAQPTAHAQQKISYELDSRRFAEDVDRILAARSQADLLVPDLRGVRQTFDTLKRSPKGNKNQC
jgi:hypothetical protein